jgi:hypothetical protein
MTFNAIDVSCAAQAYQTQATQANRLWIRRELQKVRKKVSTLRAIIAFEAPGAVGGSNSAPE